MSTNNEDETEHMEIDDVSTADEESDEDFEDDDEQEEESDEGEPEPSDGEDLTDSDDPSEEMPELDDDENNESDEMKPFNAAGRVIDREYLDNITSHFELIAVHMCPDVKLEPDLRAYLFDKLFGVVVIGGDGTHPLSLQNILVPDLTDEQVKRVTAKAHGVHGGDFWLTTVYTGDDQRIYEEMADLAFNSRVSKQECMLSGLINTTCSKKSKELLDKILTKHTDSKKREVLRMSVASQAILYRCFVEYNWEEGYEIARKWLNAEKIRKIIQASMSQFACMAQCNCEDGMYALMNNGKKLLSDVSYCVKCNPDLPDKKRKREAEEEEEHLSSNGTKGTGGNGKAARDDDGVDSGELFE
jgi:hypothetical protein